MAVMAFAGMSVAQDVWSVGYLTSSQNGKDVPAVYMNGTLINQNQWVNDYYGRNSDLDLYNGDVYFAENAYYSSDNTFYKARIRKVGGPNYSTDYLGEGSHVYDLYRFSTGSHPLVATGCKTIGGVQTAVAWINDSPSVHRQMGDGSHTSCAYGATGLNGYLYTCGYQFTNSSTYHGVIWKESSEFHAYPDGTVIYDIAYWDGYFYTVGIALQDDESKLKVWKTASDNSTSSVYYTLATSNAIGGERTKIYIDDAGDIYVTGQVGSDDKVFKNGTEIYSTGGYYYSVMANTNGVYYVGRESSSGKIWKDGSVLYSPSGANMITNLRMEDPECTSTGVLSLPFTETFENGSTSWPCWTTIDVDGNNGTDMSYWHRAGKRIASMTGNYCARHAGHTSASQNGWLITPRLFLQPFQSETKMTFKSWVNENFTVQVYVSTDSDPTITSSYTQVYSQAQSSGTQTHTVDLSAYQGQAVYIAFRYTGLLSTSWLIDNVNVTESFSPCGVGSAPYNLPFTTLPMFQCWTAYDVDMTPQTATYAPTWQYSTTLGYDGTPCVYHHYGPSGVPQTGWFFSRKFNLPAGNYNYLMSFKSKSVSSGTGRKNSVWIAVDGPDNPTPANYTTQVWEDPDYSNVWTTYTVDLTAYKGHTVSIGFKYEGTYAHNWYIDDFSLTNEIPQYTITANANNNDWGTVTGGGTYNSGASCTLTATPASGYQFQSWKKNGTVVSTDASYTFTVTENATYTAYFGEIPITYYTINTEVAPEDAGSVTGGGTYPENSSVTLTATANTGYHFEHWDDGIQENPRTITVTGDATYIANFYLDEYTISVYASPSDGGTVTGGGTFHYGETTTLTATPAEGYEFAGWSDASTENPRTVTVTGNANYTAIFNEVGATYYNVTTQANPDYAGYVDGGGTYEEGSSIVLTAVPYSGYSFTQWNDGVTQNPRTVTVTGNMSFTANFAAIPYTVTVSANPTSAGTVSGGGVYYYGDVAVLYAEAYSGYEFVGWSDGSNENPHDVTVTGNASYIATFSQAGATYYTVSTYVSPAEAGSVTGAGTYPEGTSVTLTAVANDGYSFNQWNDGSTQNPRTFTLNNNMSFTAYFNAQQYTVTVNATPAAGGTVSGGGSYSYGQTAVLTATPNTNYQFLRWGDGIVDNPRHVTVTGNVTYNALFLSEGGETFTLTVEPNLPSLGETFGSGVYPAGAAVEISAFPNPQAVFMQWNDGNTENPRTVIVNSDATYIAQFVASQQYEITVVSSDPSMGEAFGGGSYMEGSVIEISALPYDGYQFMQWSDGNTANPRSVTVTGNATYTAQFVSNSVVTHTLTLICNTDEGTVSGGGVYVEGSTATVQAFPKEGFVFDFWNDGNRENPRTVSMTDDLTLIAYFKWTSVDEFGQPKLSVYPNPANESFRIQGLVGNYELQIFNNLGEMVKTLNVNGEEEVGIQDLSSGVYMVRCGNRALRFVKM